MNIPMNYILLVNRFWKYHQLYELRITETALYLLLVDSCNKLDWKKVFCHSNAYLCGRLHITERTLVKSRQKLIDLGLIKFVSGKNKHAQSDYSLTDIGEANQEETSRLPESLITISPAVFSKDQFKKDEPIATKEQDNLKQETKQETIIKEIIIKEKEINFSEKDKEVLIHLKDTNPQVFNIFNLFNEICHAQRKIFHIGQKRIEKIDNCLKIYGYEKVQFLLHKVANSDYLQGKNNHGFLPQFNWIFNPDNCDSVIEGAYDNKAKTDYNPHFKPSPLEEMTKIYASIMEEYQNVEDE